jgi:cytochrome c oxidase subunit 2
MNELHVPVGRNIKLTMTSEDVIHSFFVPAFRLKQDVIPGQYTELWFKATKPGTYHLFCAEFCGTLHSQMTGTVTVMEPAEFERWLSTGVTSGGAAEAGGKLFIQRGCSGCHGADSSVRAPTLDGIYGRAIPVQIPQPGRPLEQTPATTLVADERYIHDSIVLPEKEVAAGYKPIMPTFEGQLTEEQIFQLTAYIRSLGRHRDPGRDTSVGMRTPALTKEDYEARTGFVPKNIQTLTGGQTGNSPAPSGRSRNPYGVVDEIGNPSTERRNR